MRKARASAEGTGDDLAAASSSKRPPRANALARRRAYDWRATAVSLFDLFARVAVQIFLPLSIAAPLIALAYRHRIGVVALDGWLALLVDEATTRCH